MSIGFSAVEVVEPFCVHDSSNTPHSGGFYNELESGRIYNEFASGGFYNELESGRIYNEFASGGFYNEFASGGFYNELESMTS